MEKNTNKIAEMRWEGGRSVIFRYLEGEDAVGLCGYINKISTENTFIRYSGETISLEEEQEYVDDLIKKYREGHAVSLVAELDGQIVGHCSLSRNQELKKKGRHIGSIGISVASDVRGKGVGEKLMSLVIAEAKHHIKGLHIIELTVFAVNNVARNLYKKLGFLEYGALPRGYYYKGEYVDKVLMYLPV